MKGETRHELMTCYIFYFIIYIKPQITRQSLIETLPIKIRRRARLVVNAPNLSSLSFLGNRTVGNVDGHLTVHLMVCKLIMH